MIPKFRAWTKIGKRMFLSDDILVIDYENKEIVAQQVYSESGLAVERDIYCCDFDELELMQSTCLKDKNGKEIFEGDILFGQAGEDFWEIVEFDIEEGKWIRRDIFYNSKLDLSENNEFMEIIGNIYENPELLEEEE